MIHLPDEDLYTLASKVLSEAAFTHEEVAAMQHIGRCDDCYRLLCCVMAMQDVSDHLEEFVASPRPTRQAVLQLVADGAASALTQLKDAAGSWIFRKPVAALWGFRSSGSAPAAPKLADIENSRNFVSYDPETGVLMIQIDGDDCSQPRGWLQQPEGEPVALSFRQQASVFRAEVPGLCGGNFTIRLEK